MFAGLSIRKALSLMLGLALATLLAAAGAWIYFNQWSKAPLAVGEEGEVLTVETGDSLRRLSARLATEGILDQPRLLSILGRLSGADQRIQRGEYRILPGTSPNTLLALLQSGDTIRYRVTFPEGIRLGEALSLLQRSEGLQQTLIGADDERLLSMVAPARSAEGFFLPETYQYQRGDTDLSVLREAHRLMRLALSDAWDERDSPLPYEDPYEVLIMASIIEKETGVAAERAEIGGVFVRRLLRGMRLQTDPTVIYGLGDGFDGNLRRSHLRDSSNRYNTYRHFGLPPSPIALPGRAALRAAVQPAAGEALYFVAKGDGSHKFSASLEEHEAAVREYQKRRRADYRSAPMPSPGPALIKEG